MTTYDEVARRWVSVVEGSSESNLNSYGRMYAEGDKIYSYGSHFELARPLRGRDGKIRYLLNGDRYSNTTSKHQSIVRGVLGGREKIILPYTALGAAGIDLDSIQIVHVMDDRWEQRHFSATEMPETARWHVHKHYEFVDMTEAEIEALLDQKHAEAVKGWQKSTDAGWEWFIKRYPEPPERLTPEDLPHHEKRKQQPLPDTKTLHTSSLPNAPEIDMTPQDDGTTLYTWSTWRHWLGSSLIRARVTWQMPHTCTWCMGRGRLEGPENKWDREPFCRSCWGRGSVARDHHRWAYFLAGFDEQESRPSFFFCELPYRSHPKTVEEAYEALKPDPVRLAEQMGREVTRQGDIFAVPTRLTRKRLKAMGARIEKRRKAEDELPYMLNTNHTATEVAYLGKLTLARGTMYHDPQWREQDHARRRMGNGADWHIIIKNTVPLARR